MGKKSPAQLRQAENTVRLEHDLVQKAKVVAVAQNTTVSRLLSAMVSEPLGRMYREAVAALAATVK